MGYFPFFIDIKSKKIVIVGGGKVALRKAEKLLPFEPHLTVIAPNICGEMSELDGIEIIRKPFSDEDISGAFAVIAASDDNALNAHIYELCTKKSIPINTVDDKEKCSFIFPAVVRKNDVCIGISTSGKSPLFAKIMREYIEDELHDNMLNALENMGRYRGYVKESFASEEQRKAAFNAIFELCISREAPPEENEIISMLEKIGCKI